MTRATDYTNEQLEAARMFNAQEKPSKKTLENMREWRDSEADTEFKREALDAAIEWLENEVL